jgi:hypothetical protein
MYTSISLYTAHDLMRFIESLQKLYYCPLKDNRRVDDSGGERAYQRVDSLEWSAPELSHGKRIKIRFLVWIRLKELATWTGRTVYLFSNTACWMITSFSNSRIHLLK